jgi:hypothetical protein
MNIFCSEKQLEINFVAEGERLMEFIDKVTIFNEHVDYINSFLPNYYYYLSLTNQEEFYKRVITNDEASINDYISNCLEKILLFIKKCIIILENNYDYPFVHMDEGRQTYLDTLLNLNEFDENYLKLLRNIRWQNTQYMYSTEYLYEKVIIFNKLLNNLPEKFTEINYCRNSKKLTERFLIQFKEAENYYKYLLWLVTSD